MFTFVFALLLTMAQALAGPPTEGWIKLSDSATGDQTGFYHYDSSGPNSGGGVNHTYIWLPPANIASGEPSSVVIRETMDGYGNTSQVLIVQDRDWVPVGTDENGNPDDVGGTNVE